MDRKIKVAAICGSLRDKSYNKMAMKYIMEGAMEAGAEIVNLDLKKYDLPVYDHDIESAGEPERISDFRNKLKNADAVIICTPEYNHSIPGSLKNAIDWASRQNVHPFRGKYTALAGVTTGAGGTIRAQMHILSVMRALGGIVLTTQVHISHAAKVIDENGKIADEATAQKLINLGKEVVELTRRKLYNEGK